MMPDRQWREGKTLFVHRISAFGKNRRTMT